MHNFLFCFLDPSAWKRKLSALVIYLALLLLQSCWYRQVDFICHTYNEQKQIQSYGRKSQLRYHRRNGVNPRYRFFYSKAPFGAKR